MNRAHVRRLVPVMGALAAVGVIATVVACGEDRPPAALDLPDAESIDSSSNDPRPDEAITLDIDIERGVEFGKVNCGSQSADKTITLTNTSRDFVNFTAKVTEGNATRFSASPESGGIPPGGTATVKISAVSIPATAEVTPDGFAGTLQLAYPQLGVPPTSIRLHQTAQGAVIGISGGTTLDVGDVQVGRTKALPITLTNTGNVPADVKLALGAGPFTLTTGAVTDPQPGSADQTVRIEAGANAGLNVVFAPTAAGDLTGTLTLSVDGATLCKPPPGNLPIAGTGTTSAGAAITLDPPSLNFGKVRCGSTAEPQDITVASVTTTNFTPDLALGENSPYELYNKATSARIVLGQPIDIAANGKFVIQVRPKPMPRRPLLGTANNAFGDTMSIKSPVDPAKTYAITQTAAGVIYSFTPPSVIGFQTVEPNNAFNFSLVNSGNVTGNYTLSSTAGACNICGTTERTAPEGNTNGVVSVVRSGSVKVRMVEDPANNVVLCRDLPGDLIINGGAPQPD